MNSSFHIEKLYTVWSGNMHTNALQKKKSLDISGKKLLEQFQASVYKKASYVKWIHVVPSFDIQCQWQVNLHEGLIWPLFLVAKSL